MLDELIASIKSLAANYKQIMANKIAELNLQPTATQTANNQTITSSVGKGGKNIAADVITVKKLLNQRIQAGLTEDNGTCGDKTIAAIQKFQQEVMGSTAPDGRIDVGGKTWKALVGNSTPTPVTPPVVPVTPPHNNTTPHTDEPTTEVIHYAKDLKGSVGKKGKNNPADVLLVKKLLNKRMRPKPNLDETNPECDADTLQAIDDFLTQMKGSSEGKFTPDTIEWKALRGAARSDMGAPDDVEVKSHANGKTPEGLPSTLVICAPEGDTSNLPVLVLVGGMGGGGALYMVNSCPAAVFKRAIVMGFGYNANLAMISKAYQDYFGRPFNKANAALCGYSAGGNVQAYMSGFGKVGLIDPIISTAWARQFTANTILSYNPAWSRVTKNTPVSPLPETKRIAESKGAIVDISNVAHSNYPEYFLGKFASQLV